MVNDKKIKQFVHFLISQKHYSKHTQMAYHRDLQKLSDFLFEEEVQDWASVNAKILNLFVMSLHQKGLNSKSIRRILSAIRSFFNFLEKDDIGKITTPKPAKKLPEVLSYETFQQIARRRSNTWQELRDSAIIEVLYSCALRVSELVALDLKDLDEAFLSVMGKGGRMRIVPIGKAAFATLRLYLQASTHDNAVFVNQHKRRLSPRWVQLMVKARALNVGVKFSVHPHMFRHAAASHFLQSSGDLLSVKEYLGHKSIASTQIYTHLNFQALAKVYDEHHPRAKK
jgi:integrase/recombinase XerC